MVSLQKTFHSVFNLLVLEREHVVIAVICAVKYHSLPNHFFFNHRVCWLFCARYKNSHIIVFLFTVASQKSDAILETLSVFSQHFPRANKSVIFINLCSQNNTRTQIPWTNIVCEWGVQLSLIGNDVSFYVWNIHYLGIHTLASTTVSTISKHSKGA